MSAVTGSGPRAQEGLGLILTVSQREVVPHQARTEDAKAKILACSDPSMSLYPLRQEEQQKKKKIVLVWQFLGNLKTE